MGNIGELQTKAKEIRKLIIRSIGQARSGHPGGSLSCADLIAALYFDIMDIDPGNPQWEDRDRFVLSKGHACPALYAALALKGYFPVEELDHLRELGAILIPARRRGWMFPPDPWARDCPLPTALPWAAG